MPHRFRIGQTVFFSLRPTETSRTAFQIVRPMPIDTDERVRYQIKSSVEAFTRIAEEYERTSA